MLNLFIILHRVDVQILSFIYLSHQTKTQEICAKANDRQVKYQYYYLAKQFSFITLATATKKKSAQQSQLSLIISFSRITLKLKL